MTPDFPKQKQPINANELNFDVVTQIQHPLKQIKIKIRYQISKKQKQPINPNEQKTKTTHQRKEQNFDVVTQK